MLVKQEVSELWRMLAHCGTFLTKDFTPTEFAAALRKVKPGKAPGPELILNAGPSSNRVDVSFQKTLQMLVQVWLTRPLSPHQLLPDQAHCLDDGK